MCVVYKAATLTASILSAQGKKMLSLEMSWLVMVRMVSCPEQWELCDEVHCDGLKR